MSAKTILITATIAFGLGFGVSEYRHMQDPVRNMPAMASPPDDSASEPEPLQVSLAEPAPAPEVGPTAVAPVEQSPLARAQQLVANNALPAAVQLLNDILHQNSLDAEALLLLARVLEKQGQHEGAVTTWFRYLNTEVDAKKIEEALAYLSRYLIRLVNNPGIFGESRAWLMAQLNDLIKLTPDNGELHLQLADMHLKTDDKEQAQYHALMAANQDATRTRAENFMARMLDETLAAQSMEQEIQVPLIRFGSQFLVPVNVEGQTVKLLLDTGASISGLTSGFLNRHYSFVKSPKPIQLNTASGTVESVLFVVDTLQIADLTFNKHMLARLPMDNDDHFDGLLGVDILGRFDFVLDQDKAVLRLRKRQ